MGDSVFDRRRRQYNRLRGLKSMATATAGALITLHQPEGVVYVNPEEIMIVAPAKILGAAKALKDGSAVTVHDKTIFVLETPAEVKRLRDGG